ncbi:hypothetical protein [Xanthocytophaga agilis]|uniref:Uncharacterized protein n=1 Tax=Xanthocytophaga agilis TaxID=3048010 RepID=A0AAE3UHL7_9BACT|nr:hypothetical protein [Xanthocytophaga agilis]MDJ1502773.1 hypothetical protein [Xanthocytophaga agilis]
MTDTHKEITDLLIQKSAIDPKDPAYMVHCQKVLDYLQTRKKEVIDFIDQLTDTQLLFQLSPFFENLAVEFQSTRFIDAIEKLPRRFSYLGKDEMYLLTLDIVEAQKKTLTADELSFVYHIKRLDELCAQGEDKLIARIEQTEDQTFLLEIVELLLEITDQLKSHRVIDAVEKVVHKLENPKDQEEAVSSIQEARELLISDENMLKRKQEFEQKKHEFDGILIIAKEVLDLKEDISIKDLAKIMKELSESGQSEKVLEIGRLILKQLK